MKNEFSTSGELEDLIRSMVQLASVELHKKTALEIAEGDLASLEDDEVQAGLDRVTQAEDELKEVTQLRRNAMNIITAYSDEIDYHKWCEVKHTAMAMYTAFEAYQANDSTALYDYYLACNKLFIKTVSQFLGIDIPACAACFTDALKGAEQK